MWGRTALLITMSACAGFQQTRTLVRTNTTSFRMLVTGLFLSMSDWREFQNPQRSRLTHVPGGCLPWLWPEDVTAMVCLVKSPHSPEYDMFAWHSLQRHSDVITAGAHRQSALRGNRHDFVHLTQQGNFTQSGMRNTQSVCHICLHWRGIKQTRTRARYGKDVLEQTKPTKKTKEWHLWRKIQTPGQLHLLDGE